MSDQEGFADKAKGMAKEAAGKVTGDDSREREGQAEQMKGQKEDEAQRAEAEAKKKRQEQAGYEGQARKEGS